MLFHSVSLLLPTPTPCCGQFSLPLFHNHHTVVWALFQFHTFAHCCPYLAALVSSYSLPKPHPPINIKIKSHVPHDSSLTPSPGTSITLIFSITQWSTVLCSVVALMCYCFNFSVFLCLWFLIPLTSGIMCYKSSVTPIAPGMGVTKKSLLNCSSHSLDKWNTLIPGNGHVL